MKRTAALILLSALVIAGCSSSKPPPSTPPTRPGTTAAFSVASGMDATAIAAHIPGCADVAAGNIGAGSQTELSSAAHCTLSGQIVIVDSWTQTGNSHDVDQLASPPTYYAAGATWTVITGDPGVDPAKSILQMQITNDASGLLKAPQSQAPASLDAEKTVAQAAAAALGGTVLYAKGGN